MFWNILDSTKRFDIHNAPVGAGKTVGYVTAAIAGAISAGKRVAILTESKALQDQIAADFGVIGLYDMRGLQNYTCNALLKGGEFELLWQKRWGQPMCDVGPCTAGLRCDLKDAGCEYFDHYRSACLQPLVSTNMAYWIAIHKYGQGLGKFDWLIIDECHTADMQLSSALSVEFTEKDFKLLKSKPLKAKDPLQNWRMWGRAHLMNVQAKIEFFTAGAKIGMVGEDKAIDLIRDTDLPDAVELKQWKKLEGKCTTLSESSDDWIVEADERTGNIRIAPVWVRQYAEDNLFLNIPKVVMTSATVPEKIVDLLGIAKDRYTYTEYPSTFPVERRPIYWIPTVRLNYNSSPEALRTWVVQIDSILERRQDRKGIIHTISYERQKYLLANSRFRHIMHANIPGNTRDVVKSFREANAPAILVSPSVGTGFDFPYDAARFQIIGKVPFRDPRGAIMAAQAKEDPEYMDHLTAQDLIQMYGRSNRAPTDYSETFIVDDHIEWFLQKCSDRYYDKSRGRFNMQLQKGSARKSRLVPNYFVEAFQRIDSSSVLNPPPLGAFC